jgi:membrane protein YdbS with pleckstrin-like domain
MRCNECGTEASIESVFCHKCGARLAVDSTPSSQSEEAVGEESAADPPPKEEPPQQLTTAEKLITPPGGEDTEETTLWEGGYCAMAMLGEWILTGLLSVAVIIAMVFFPKVWLFLLIGLAVLWCVQYLRYLYRRFSVHYRLTDHRFFHTEGLIRRVADRIEVIDMDDITCVQGPIERMVGVGTIHVTSSDRTHPVIDLPGIANAQDVAEKLDKARRAERLKRGIHIEAI